MPRSLRVRQEFIGTVRLAVKRSGFFSNQSLSEDLGMARSTVSNFLTGKPVDRAVFEEICEKLSLTWQEIVALDAEDSSFSFAIKKSIAQTPLDWGEAPDVPAFYGRNNELVILDHWIKTKRCRLVSILGMGGIGKTSLTVKLVERVQEGFEFVIWRSLLNAPPIEEILQELIQFLSLHQEIDQTEPIARKVSRLLKYLRQHRCLVVLDNVESVLQTNPHTNLQTYGSVGPQSSEYGDLFKRVGEENHQSCLLLNSREKPREIARLEGVSLVRSLVLKGLTQAEGQEIFKAKGCFGESDRQFQEVFEHYAGNPLALHIVASRVQEVFEGDVAELISYVRQEDLRFQDINDLLWRQFNRISEPERHLMCWLAVNREPVLLAELEADVFLKPIARRLVEAVEALGRRFLIERSEKRLMLQPVVMEYVTYQLVTEVCEEILAQQRGLLRYYALLKAESKDYIRQTQIRLIVRPILDELMLRLGSSQKIEQRLKEILVKQQTEAPFQPGYVGGNVLNLLCQLNADLSRLDCSKLAIWQAYLVGSHLHQVNFSEADLSRSLFTDQFGATLSVTFSSDGKQFAAGNEDGRVRIWQTATGQKHLTLEGHTSWAVSVAFSPDGQWLASGSFDQTIRLWDRATGQCLKIWLGHVSWIWSVRFSPDGQMLVSSSDDNTVRLWDVATGNCLKTLQGHTAPVWCAIFSPDGQAIASGGDDQIIRFWDVQTGQLLKIFQGHTGWVRSLAFSSNGQTLISCGGDCTVKIWEVATATCLRTFQAHPTLVNSLALSPDGQILATGGQDSTVRIWEVSSGECLRILQGHPNGIWSAAFHPDGETLISGSNDSTIKLWNVKTGQSLRTLQGYNNGVRAIAFSPDDQLLASGGNDKEVKLWQVRSGECIKTLKGHTGWIWGLAFDQQGQILASAGNDCVRLWDVASGRLIRTLQGHTNLVISVAFSPDNQILASGSNDQTIKLWDIQSGDCLETLSCPGRVWLIAFAPKQAIARTGNPLLAAGFDDGTVRLWNFQSGECIKILQGHTSVVFAVAFSPDGQLLATGCHDKTVRVWEVRSGKCLQVLPCTGQVWSVSFAATGQILASGDDQTVKLWDVWSGECLKTLQAHTNIVYSTAFMSDRSILASAGQDGLIKLWNAQTGALINTLRSNRPYEQMNITGITGLTEAQKNTLKALGAFEL